MSKLFGLMVRLRKALLLVEKSKGKYTTNSMKGSEYKLKNNKSLNQSSNDPCNLTLSDRTRESGSEMRMSLLKSSKLCRQSLNISEHPSCMSPCLKRVAKKGDVR